MSYPYIEVPKSIVEYSKELMEKYPCAVEVDKVVNLLSKGLITKRETMMQLMDIEDKHFSIEMTEMFIRLNRGSNYNK